MYIPDVAVCFPAKRRRASAALQKCTMELCLDNDINEPKGARPGTRIIPSLIASMKANRGFPSEMTAGMRASYSGALMRAYETESNIVGETPTIFSHASRLKTSTFILSANLKNLFEFLGHNGELSANFWRGSGVVTKE